VYGIEATALLPLLTAAAHRQLFGSQHAGAAEVRYRRVLAGLQLSTDFFFSFTWPVHQTVQRTFVQQAAAAATASAAAAPEEGALGGAAMPAAAAAAAAGEEDDPFGSHRVWNEFLSRPLREALGGPAAAARWVVPLAHGSFQQRSLALVGRPLQLTLVARRSRQFAGTRYLKRGVTDRGHVANDVEVEQIVEARVDWKSGQPLLSSVVQVGGRAGGCSAAGVRVCLSWPVFVSSACASQPGCAAFWPPKHDQPSPPSFPPPNRSPSPSHLLAPQVRGSIPLPWAQRPDSSMLKPEIVLHNFDPLFAATRRHFDQLRWASRRVGAWAVGWLWN
jgi:hypothetical protein